MVRIKLTLLLLCLTTLCFSQQVNDLSHLDGDDWNNFTAKEKLRIVQGIMMGSYFILWCLYNYEVYIPKQLVDALSLHWFTDVNIVEDLNHFYTYEQCKPIPIYQAIWIRKSLPKETRP